MKKIQRFEAVNVDLRTQSLKKDASPVPFLRRTEFTLIELLVIIAIIAILRVCFCPR